MSEPGFRAMIPNALTCGRLILAATFFGVLARYQFPLGSDWMLPTAIGLFTVAALTDALDGYLARKWNVVSVFGRIVDPFADKVLILGAFVMLAGPGFAMYEGWGLIGVDGREPRVLRYQMTGVQPWMVVVILARELLVTTIRAVLEGRGIDFSASWSGKAKMIVQSVAVPYILLLVYMMQAEALDWVNASARSTTRPSEMLQLQRATLVAWVTTIVTAASAVPYIMRGMAALRSPPSKEGNP